MRLVLLSDTHGLRREISIPDGNVMVHTGEFHNPLRLLPAGATVAGRDSHPLGNGAFSRRTKINKVPRRSAPIAPARSSRRPNWTARGYLSSCGSGKVIAFGKAPAAPARDLDDDQDGDSSILLEGVWSELIAE